MRRLIDSGACVLLIPGGVAECLLLRHDGVETVYLRKRFGFVKMALQTGSHLIPAFAFGQSRIYSFWRPPSDAWLSKTLARAGFAPLLFWGRWASPVPFPVPVHVVVGAPLRVTKDAEPSDEAVAALLARFCDAMEALFEEHKAAAGYAQNKLVIL